MLCPKCGAQLSDSAVICRACGAMLPEQPAATQVPYPPASQPAETAASAQPNAPRTCAQCGAPLEDGEVTITRAAGSVTLPSRFMLVGAMNPCRCGWYGHPSGRCRCSQKDVEKYVSKISGPLLDRMDLQVSVPSVEFEAMRRREKAESSAAVRERVNAARDIQKKRFAGTPITCNAYMTAPMVGEFCRLDAAGEKLLKGAFDRLGLTARSHDKLLRVARTIADLDGSERIESFHLAEAIQYRNTDILRGEG